MKKRKLNIGCGLKKFPDFINIDSDPACKPDIVRDIEKGLPFDDNTIDAIRCEHVLEHVHDLIFVMNEFHRVLKPDGQLLIESPLITDKWAYIDPGHVRYFNEHSFNFFMVRDWNSEHSGVTGWYALISKEVKDGSIKLILEVMK